MNLIVRILAVGVISAAALLWAVPAERAAGASAEFGWQTRAMGADTGQASEPQVKDIKARLAKVTQEKDQRGIERVLNELWDADPDAGLKAARQLLSSRDETHPVIGAAVIGARGVVSQVEATLRTLKNGHQHDERRWLVRALGTKAGEATRAARALEPWLKDRDKLVRAAAMHALVELGDARALAIIAADLPGSAPAAESGDWHEDEDGPLEMAQYGAVRWLAGVRAENPRDVQAWLKANPPRGEVITPPEPPDPQELVDAPVKRGGKAVYQSPSFDVLFRAAGTDGPGSITAVEGEGTGWPRLASMLERAAGFAVNSGTQIFGRVYLPPVRLYIADDRQFTALADVPTSFAGSSKGNEVVVRVGAAAAMAGVLAHEYVHVIHQASFPEQPRWLAEGLAESLTRSSAGTAWTGALVEESGIGRDVAKGVFSEALSWKTGGTTGRREAELYTLSWLAVDYLRFGPFGAAEARLAFLMGRLSRGQPAEQAIRGLYGLSGRELDAGVRSWLEVR